MSQSITLRAAHVGDAQAIHQLIVQNLELGHLLPRTLEDVEQHADRFFVADSQGAVVGCAELAPLSDGVAEVRSLVVDEAIRGHRIGTRLVDALSEAATARGFGTLCAFTHEPSHFVRLGFTIVPHIWVPEKIAHDCTSCALFRRCGQYAVTLALREGVFVRPERPAAVIRGARTLAPHRPAAERLQLREISSTGDREAVPV